MHDYSLLFARVQTSLECRCGAAGYCPCCGAYEPPTKDPEVIAAVSEASRRGQTSGNRVIRKRLES